jgi:hypothetical protein
MTSMIHSAGRLNKSKRPQSLVDLNTAGLLRVVPTSSAPACASPSWQRRTVRFVFPAAAWLRSGLR